MAIDGERLAHKRVQLLLAHVDQRAFGFGHLDLVVGQESAVVGLAVELELDVLLVLAGGGVWTRVLLLLMLLVASILVQAGLEEVFEKGGGRVRIELGHVLGVVEAGGEHLGHVGHELHETLRTLGVEVLVQVDQVDEAVVQHHGHAILR